MYDILLIKNLYTLSVCRSIISNSKGYVHNIKLYRKHIARFESFCYDTLREEYHFLRNVLLSEWYLHTSHDLGWVLVWLTRSLSPPLHADYYNIIKGEGCSSVYRPHTSVWPLWSSG